MNIAINKLYNRGDKLSLYFMPRVDVIGVKMAQPYINLKDTVP